MVYVLWAGAGTSTSRYIIGIFSSLQLAQKEASNLSGLLYQIVEMELDKKYYES